MRPKPEKFKQCAFKQNLLSSQVLSCVKAAKSITQGQKTAIKMPKKN